MVASACSHELFYTAAAGLVAGVVFTLIVGNLDASHYLVELMSIGLLEIPFILIVAVLVRKYIWSMGMIYSIFGTAASVYVISPGFSITPIVFLKTAVMGLILGEIKWFSGSFTWRLLAVSFPGFVLACAFGLPLILQGVSPGTMDEIRKEALELYQAFMSRDDAVNATENALVMFRVFFRVAFSIFFLASLVFSWLSFHISRWIMLKFKQEPEYIPPIYTFKLPFHAIWIFLIGLGFLLSEIKPFFPIALNVFIIMAGLYGIQGLAVVIYHMNRISIGQLPRILFWLIFFITLTFSGIFLILIGLINNWVNLRKPPFSPQTNGQDEGNNYEGDS